jgi:hypothetical protein
MIKLNELSRNERLSDICAKRHLRKATFAQSDICAKRHLREATFAQSDICTKRHLCERHLREVGKWLYWQPILT